jgi:hypothetical protein
MVILDGNPLKVDPMKIKDIKGGGSERGEDDLQDVG